jgi:hypothetical protein
MTSTEPTPEDLARDLAICDEATPGPWRAERDALGHWRILWPHSRNGSIARKGKVFSDEDAAFIAAAREGWPAALRRLAALEAEVAALKARLAAAYDRVAAQSELLSRRAEAGTDG